MTVLPAWRTGLIRRTLDNQGVIAYPTEGVWGLGCLPWSRAAVARILQIKQRSWREGLLLVGADIGQFDDYLEGISDEQRTTLEAAWPGPVTFLVPDNGVAPAWIVGRHRTLGIRVSAHPLVAALARVAGPLVSTSANVSGQPAAISALRVRQQFADSVDLIVPGVLGGRAGPSEIRRLDDGEVIR